MSNDYDKKRALTRERFERVLKGAGWRYGSYHSGRYASDVWFNESRAFELDEMGIFYWRGKDRVAGLAWDSFPYHIPNDHIKFRDGRVIQL